MESHLFVFQMCIWWFGKIDVCTCFHMSGTSTEYWLMSLVVWFFCWLCKRKIHRCIPEGYSWWSSLASYLKKHIEILFPIFSTPAMQTIIVFLLHLIRNIWAANRHDEISVWVTSLTGNASVFVFIFITCKCCGNTPLMLLYLSVSLMFPCFLQNPISFLNHRHRN